LSFKVAAIGDRDTVAGFALAGVAYTYIHSKKEETLAKLNGFLNSREIGLILLTHRVAEELGFELRQMIQKKKLLPMMLRIPDKTGYAPKTDELRDLIRRTVGAEIIVKREGE